VQQNKYQRSESYEKSKLMHIMVVCSSDGRLRVFNNELCFTGGQGMGLMNDPEDEDAYIDSDYK
jgi:hypothetical protein